MLNFEDIGMPKKLIGHPHLSEVRDFVIKKYGARVPGPEHRDYVIKNPHKVSRDLKSGNHIFFFREMEISGLKSAGCPA